MGLSVSHDDWQRWYLMVHCSCQDIEMSWKKLLILINSKTLHSSIGLMEHILFLTPSYQPCYQPEKDELLKRGPHRQRMDVLLKQPPPPPSGSGTLHLFRHSPNLACRPKALFHFLEALFDHTHCEALVLQAPSCQTCAKRAL